MTLREFNSKSIIERADILWSWGYFMVKRRQGTKSISLFAVNGFFAELVISKLDNRVLGINGYSVEEVPLDYFRIINHDNPFMSAALHEKELLDKLVVAA